MSPMSQEKAIKSYLKKGGKLTALKALKLFGSFRLSARIDGLKRQGLNIVSKRVTRGGKSFSEYSLA